jgi:hypothetical protein
MKSKLKMDNLNIKDLDHLGIVAGIIDEMGLVEIINEEVGTHPQEKLSVGIIVKAMILNCLGCVNAPLYGSPEQRVIIRTYHEKQAKKRFRILSKFINP